MEIVVLCSASMVFFMDFIVPKNMDRFAIPFPLRIAPRIAPKVI